MVNDFLNCIFTNKKLRNEYFLYFIILAGVKNIVSNVENIKIKSIYLSLGSNIGNRKENIIFALSLLQSSGFVDIKEISTFHETSPVAIYITKLFDFRIMKLTININLKTNTFLIITD